MSGSLVMCPNGGRCGAQYHDPSKQAYKNCQRAAQSGAPQGSPLQSPEQVRPMELRYLRLVDEYGAEDPKQFNRAVTEQLVRTWRPNGGDLHRDPDAIGVLPYVNWERTSEPVQYTADDGQERTRVTVRYARPGREEQEMNIDAPGDVFRHRILEASRNGEASAREYILDEQDARRVDADAEREAAIAARETRERSLSGRIRRLFRR